MMLRIRNKGIRKVRVADLEDAPWNFRTHPDKQQTAFGGAVDEIGWYGYPDVYETPEGHLRICDGHLRKAWLIEQYGANAKIEVNVTDFDDREAKIATATHDSLAAMAEADGEALSKLLAEIETGSDALEAMLKELGKDSDEPIELRQVDTKPPPVMTWVLVGIPTVRFGEIAETVSALADLPEVILETTANDGPKD